jgi:hypothetical protein
MVVEVDDVEEPGVVTVDDVDDVEVGTVDEVVVVGEPEVGELAPTRRPTTSAPSARGIKKKRPNFDGSDAFTQPIYFVARYRSGALRIHTTLCLSRSQLDLWCSERRNAIAIAGDRSSAVTPRS